MTLKTNWPQVGTEVLMNTFKRDEKVMVSASGSYITDQNGKQYLDFISGIAVNSLGHAHPAIVNTLTHQASQLIHSSNLFWNIPSIELGQQLTQLSGLDKVFFSNSGAEANEAAIKFARKWGRETKGDLATEIISMKQSFHGRTLATLSATGQEEMHKDFAPNVEGFHYVPFNDSDALTASVSDTTCAIMLEVIQGEGGVHHLSDAFIQTIKSLQVQHDLLIIIDEVQTGIGRTGTYFAFQQFDLHPDIISLAKGLGGGFPIGATLTTNKVASHLNPGDHGTTFGGNPLATAVANTVLQEIQLEKLLDNVNARSQQLIDGLTAIQKHTTAMIDIRGLGLLIGVAFDDTVMVNNIIQACYDRGLLLISAKGNVIRFLPPLNVSASEINQALKLFESTLDGEG